MPSSRKRPYSPMGSAKQVQAPLDGVEAISPSHAGPWRLLVIRDHAAMQFYVMDVTEVQRGNKLVGLGDEVVDLPLKYRYAGQDKVPFIRILHGSGVVQVEEVQEKRLA